MNYKWKLKERVSGDIITQLLANRGIGEREKQAFLNPDWDRDTNDPFLFTNMQSAVDKVFIALENKQKIVIHGDYDADGVSGSSLLYITILELADKIGTPVNLDVYLPDREKDGYGVALHTVGRMIKEGVNLIITVDCGIANADVFEVAQQAGVDVIICDHHQMAPEIPKHAIIIHPLVAGEVYPNKNLCGTGVAFKLASALIIEARKRNLDFPIGHEKWLTDFVAIATVTDVMPLLGENRALEKFGLQALNKTRRLGLQKIIEMSGTELGSIDTQTIGYRIGPRINAAGRIGSARSAFNALVAKTEQEAEEHANTLEMLNRKRQEITELSYNEAKRLVTARKDAHVHVVWNETWAPGIVGLIAGKIVTEFGVPAFALTRVDDKYVGSGRSINGLHLVEAMRSCGDIFIKAGGHPEACGLTISGEDNIRLFRERINIYAKDFFADTNVDLSIDIDAELPFEEITFDAYYQIRQFEPFGKGNPEPVFSASGTILKADAVGKTGTHLKITLMNHNGVNQLIGFGFGELAGQLTVGTKIDVAYELSVNEWNGNISLQGRIIDIIIKNS
ncbi:single-stranded-DNA-specific exonuclease RecJ [Candidatus Uhrbacteria bacterium CG_4_9_14_0_2_um_filter_41_50]|uniref:Single-stranded-DNA-specific exonuclease RecJ n=1 Tax=Candidatus Uhrbacteria bacterium CG_4_9_14_0_2_um_filter_41_50 TaxID=1975031 RepID=A0A2M8ENG4_9BACT|nr:MAG: single-stranded-DNA-specific exonuclease RecJ [Candidatus Uhrbacteria bacterium CG_4_10_14_3_um_filter_41_21]PIZ54201.1 MAG: single-stranded-DNA-specific exonuclease RecJ [Candidatus Uhrbacteria bacterium CG_4_10_14_0_2_um_filter_41_21]PJB84931.1 MAG: single-stranded-DNA-specific exonuclease RecJ [Candidatus Uhrbacteria bacterium CG_4_9_14_0_8_um_filter_41_16]PJC24197.1 MAG: single-stranded-DNA-specific exonuclease RecJ [Candidatus Uhrbacteria bacterium CG_4_9_14_0_2_um_filter_41_50]PJE